MEKENYFMEEAENLHFVCLILEMNRKLIRYLLEEHFFPFSCSYKR